MKNIAKPIQMKLRALKNNHAMKEILKDFDKKDVDKDDIHKVNY